MKMCSPWLLTSGSFTGQILRPWHQSYMSATLSSEKVHLLKPGHLQGMPCPAALANRPTWATLAARPGHSAVADTMRLRVSTMLVQLATSKYVRATFRFRGRRVEGIVVLFKGGNGWWVKFLNATLLRLMFVSNQKRGLGMYLRAKANLDNWWWFTLTYHIAIGSNP